MRKVENSYFSERKVVEISYIIGNHGKGRNIIEHLPFEGLIEKWLFF